MRFNKLMVAGALGVTLLSIASCGTPKDVTYFQDFHNNPDTVLTLQQKLITVKPKDKLYIGVKSKDKQLSELFSLTSGSTSTVSSVSKDAYYYTIDSEGNIDFPILGKIAVAGKTREQVAQIIKEQLMSQDLVKDPVVTVGLGNLHYSVIGEVNTPGEFPIEDEQVTILDAIGKAGDLTIQGNRNDVMVLRQEGDHQKIYKMNLCSGKNVFNSPAYYLQQNDVVYVSPNETKQRSSTVNGNTVQSVGFWMSVASLVMAVLTFLKVN